MILAEVERAEAEGHGVQEGDGKARDEVVRGIQQLDQWGTGGVAVLVREKVSEDVVTEVEEHWSVRVQRAVVEY